MKCKAITLYLWGLKNGSVSIRCTNHWQLSVAGLKQPFILSLTPTDLKITIVSKTTNDEGNWYAQGRNFRRYGIWKTVLKSTLPTHRWRMILCGIRGMVGWSFSFLLPQLEMKELMIGVPILINLPYRSFRMTRHEGDTWKTEYCISGSHRCRNRKNIVAKSNCSPILKILEHYFAIDALHNIIWSYNVGIMPILNATVLYPDLKKFRRRDALAQVTVLATGGQNQTYRTTKSIGINWRWNCHDMYQAKRHVENMEFGPISPYGII